MMSSSMIDFCTGRDVGWTRKTSCSRTLSTMRTKMFSLANSNTSDVAQLAPR